MGAPGGARRTHTLAILALAAFILAAPGPVAEPAQASLVICDVEDDPVGGAQCTANHYLACVEDLIESGACRL